MLVKAAVLGRQHRLEQMLGKLIERDGVIVLDAAAADFIAVAIEESDREILFLQPIVRGLAEGRNGEEERQDGAAEAECQALASEFDTEAPPALHMEPVHEGGEARVSRAELPAAVE